MVARFEHLLGLVSGGLRKEILDKHGRKLEGGRMGQVFKCETPQCSYFHRGGHVAFLFVRGAPKGISAPAVELVQ